LKTKILKHLEMQEVIWRSQLHLSSHDDSEKFPLMSCVFI
jgi:hypothetical protein